MDTRASRYAMWRLHAPPSREADINPNPQKGGYPAPDRVTFLTGANRDFPNWRRQVGFTNRVVSQCPLRLIRNRWCVRTGWDDRPQCARCDVARIRLQQYPPVLSLFFPEAQSALLRRTSV